MGVDFRDWFSTKLIPSLAVQPKMVTFARAVGDVFDSLLFKLDQAVKQRFARYTSRGGLAALGDERGLSRSINSTELQYRQKVKDAWKLWPKAGTPYGLLVALADAGYNPELITKAGHHYTLPVDGSFPPNDVLTVPHTMDAEPAFWNRFAVYLRPPYPSGGVPLQTSDEGKALLLLIEKWKPSVALLKEVVWLTSGLTWDTFPAGATWDAQGRATWDTSLPVVTVWSF